MQKVIAGKFRGRKLKSCEGLEIRPILARIKKSLFDILSKKLDHAHFLDLYAGTGSVGIEALSRGAIKVVFIDNNIKSIRIIKHNLETCGVTDKETVEVLQHNVDLKLRLVDKFNIIFSGTPYHTVDREFIHLGKITLENVSNLDIFNTGCWLIIQHHSTEHMPEIVNDLVMFRQKKYGDTILTFYTFHEK